MFTPKFNIGALVMIATTPPVHGTVTGFYNAKPDEEPFYCVQRSDTLEDNWYREAQLSLPQPKVVMPSQRVGKTYLGDFWRGLEALQSVPKESAVDKAAREYKEASEELEKAAAAEREAEQNLERAREHRKTKRSNKQAAYTKLMHATGAPAQSDSGIY